MNCFTIGVVIFGLSKLGLFSKEVFDDLTITRSLLFSALISAVDPVAVLAIFAEIGVNPVLYFLVFGESLLNDAVTVVLYRTMAAFTEMESITALEILKGKKCFFFKVPTLVGIFWSNLFCESFGCLSHYLAWSRLRWHDNQRKLLLSTGYFLQNIIEDSRLAKKFTLKFWKKNAIFEDNFQTFPFKKYTEDLLVLCLNDPTRAFRILRNLQKKMKNWKHFMWFLIPSDSRHFSENFNHLRNDRHHFFSLSIEFLGGTSIFWVWSLSMTEMGGKWNLGQTIIQTDLSIIINVASLLIDYVMLIYS